MDALTFLHEIPLFAAVDPDALARLAAAAEMSSVPAGHTVLFKGETVDGLYVIVAGRVAVTAKILNKGVVQLAELGAGEVFGETSIVERGIAGANIKCVADCSLMMIPQGAFRELLVADEPFALRVNDLIRARKGAPAPTPTPA